MFLFELAADRVLYGIGKPGKTLDEAQDEEDGCIVSDRYGGVALFDPVQRHAAERGALGEDGDGNAPPPSGVADILAELADGPQNGYRKDRR
jgi:hypothetical protein